MNIRPIKDNDLPQLVQKAAEDAHFVVSPTHVFVKNDELVGYISLGRIPMIMTWLSTRRVQPIDSVKALRKVEEHSIMSNVPVICIPCATDSPFYPQMEKLGYTEAPLMRFFFKKLIE